MILGISNWKATHDSYFSRRLARRMSAEQTWDAIAQAAGVTQTFKIGGTDKVASQIGQVRGPGDVERADKPLYRVLQAFGQCDRYAIEATRKPSMVQSAILLNDISTRTRVAISKGSRLEALLRGAGTKSNDEIVDELYLAALSRFPSDREKQQSIELLKEHHEQGGEDLLWVLVNRLDFLFY